MIAFNTIFKRAIICLVVVCFLACTIFGCGKSLNKSGDATTIKIAVAMPEDDFRCDYIKQFKADVEEGTDGRVLCEIHYIDDFNDQLIAYETIKKGKIDMAVIAAPYFTDLIPEEGITGLPYLFGDHETAWEFAKSDINKAIDEKLEKKGLKVICHYCGSFRCLSNSKHTINAPEDMKGLIIGTVRSKVLMDMFSMLGATSYNYIGAELYDNLNRRTYDGADWSVTTFYTNQYYKLQPYVSVTNHAYNLWNVVMRTDVYNSLGDEDRAVVDAAAESSSLAEQKGVHEFEDDIFKKLTALGVEVTYPDLKPFMDATEKIRENYSGDFKDVYEETKVWLANR